MWCGKPWSIPVNRRSEAQTIIVQRWYRSGCVALFVKTYSVITFVGAWMGGRSSKIEPYYILRRVGNRARGFHKNSIDLRAGFAGNLQSERSVVRFNLVGYAANRSSGHGGPTYGTLGVLTGLPYGCRYDIGYRHAKCAKGQN